MMPPGRFPSLSRKHQPQLNGFGVSPLGSSSSCNSLGLMTGGCLVLLWSGGMTLVKVGSEAEAVRELPTSRAAIAAITVIFMVVLLSEAQGITRRLEDDK
jgi:hypothetical protein